MSLMGLGFRVGICARIGFMRTLNPKSLSLNPKPEALNVLSTKVRSSQSSRRGALGLKVYRVWG